MTLPSLPIFGKSRYCKNRRRGFRQAAFSLVEVTIATGLVTFAMLVIFSLLPVGLNSLQASSRQIAEAEIFNLVEAEVNSTPFDKLEDYQTGQFPLYFDYEGLQLAPAKKDDASYIARCATPVAETGGEVKRVTISVGYRVDPNDSGTASQITKRTFLVANRGI
ncbi:MAG: Verru_Chthon cassette protein B [Chthoniobacterales bacterium]